VIELSALNLSRGNHVIQEAAQAVMARAQQFEEHKQHVEAKRLEDLAMRTELRKINRDIKAANLKRMQRAEEYRRMLLQEKVQAELDRTR